MIRILALALALLPMGVSAQQASNGTGGELRVLDKVTGAVSDLNLAIGASEQIGYLRVTAQHPEPSLRGPVRRNQRALLMHPLEVIDNQPLRSQSLRG